MIAYTAGGLAVAAALMLPAYAATRVPRGLRLTHRAEQLAAWSLLLGMVTVLAVVGAWEGSA